MGITHVCDREKNIIFIVWDGAVTADDWLNQAPKLLAEPDWPNISRLIADVHTATDTASITDTVIEKITALYGARPEIVSKKRLAILANDLFGKARRFGTLLSRYGTSVIVFNRLSTACTFLGIDPTDTGQILDQLRARLRSAG